MKKADYFVVMNKVFAPSDVAQIELSDLLCKKFHAGQFRKSETDSLGNPLRYSVHPRRVSYSMVVEAGVTDCDLVCAGNLHDVIEDAHETILISRLIERCFNPEVTRYVRAVTKEPKFDSFSRLQKACEETPKIAFIKAADRLDNLRSLPKDNEAFCLKQKRETQELYLPLFAKHQHTLGAGFANLVQQIAKICA